MKQIVEIFEGGNRADCRNFQEMSRSEFREDRNNKFCRKFSW
jgi:hypothetical protein